MTVASSLISNIYLMVRKLGAEHDQSIMQSPGYSSAVLNWLLLLICYTTDTRQHPLLQVTSSCSTGLQFHGTPRQHSLQGTQPPPPRIEEIFDEVRGRRVRFLTSPRLKMTILR
jgi:hypothetical protein